MEKLKREVGQGIMTKIVTPKNTIKEKEAIVKIVKIRKALEELLRNMLKKIPT